MSTILWIGAGLLATQLPKILRAGNVVSNLIPELRGLRANMRFNPFPVLNLIATMDLKNFSGVGLRANNVFIRAQYQNEDNSWSDLASSNEVLNTLNLEANKTKTQNFSIAAPLLNFSSITSQTPLKLNAQFEVAGIPQTVTIKEFTIGQYLPANVLDKLKSGSRNTLTNLINGL